MYLLIYVNLLFVLLYLIYLSIKCSTRPIERERERERERDRDRERERERERETETETENSFQKY